MNRSMIIFALVGIGLFYGITNFVGKLKDDDNRLMDENDYNKKDDAASFRTDVVGNSVIVASSAPIAKRIEVWKRSLIHEEYIAKFPDFSEMKLFIDDRVQDEELKGVIITALEKVESSFFAGKLSPILAKEEIDKLQ